MPGHRVFPCATWSFDFVQDTGTVDRPARRTSASTCMRGRVIGVVPERADMRQERHGARPPASADRDGPDRRRQRAARSADGAAAEDRRAEPDARRAARGARRPAHRPDLPERLTALSTTTRRQLIIEESRQHASRRRRRAAASAAVTRSASRGRDRIDADRSSSAAGCASASEFDMRWPPLPIPDRRRADHRSSTSPPRSRLLALLSRCSATRAST